MQIYVENRGTIRQLHRKRETTKMRERKWEVRPEAKQIHNIKQKKEQNNENLMQYM